MNILALDPALRTGYAWTDGTRTEYGAVNLNDPPTIGMSTRLSRLEAWLERRIEEWKPDTLAVEDATAGAKFYKTREFHSMFRGVITLVAGRRGLAVIWVKPTTIKTMAGSGRAKKDQMIRAAKTLLGIDVKGDDNVADALFLLEVAKQLANNTLKLPPPKKRPRKTKFKGGKQLPLWLKQAMRGSK